MTLEGLADLIRANSANTNRSISDTRHETYSQLLNIQNDLTDVRGDIKTVQGDVTVLKGDMTEVRRTLDLAETVAAMKRQIEMLEPRSLP